MKKVIKYQTEDGYYWDTKEQAIEHEKKLAIVKGLYDSLDFLTEFEAEEIVEWLKRNADRVKEYLGC